MFAKRVVACQAWMKKTFAVMLHAYPRHDSLRAKIPCSAEGNQRIGFKPAEGYRQRATRRFASVAFAPVVKREPPAYLQAWHERHIGIA